MSNQLLEKIETCENIGIAAHIRPDGDAVGSCFALSNYIKENYPDKNVKVFLEDIPASLEFLVDEEALHSSKDSFDLFVSLDCGDTDRLGKAYEVFEKTPATLNIDHHISNTMFGDEQIVKGDASSTCEILCDLLPMDQISQKCATCLYTGIIHDTGVFKHSNTGEKTMAYAGALMEKGIPFGKIIDESFYQKTYRQLQILGRCLLESVRILDGTCIFSIVSRRTMEFYQTKNSDLDGVIDELRTTEGVEVAILLTEIDNLEYKVSMRSNDYVDVSKIAVFFNGGGHVKAAGCTIKGAAFDVINNLTEHIEKQILAHEQNQ